ncbi:hypothetical protein CICLE_v10003545mg, partial [Citrus x clementina]
MCFARDLDGRNPLHLAAMKGRIDALALGRVVQNLTACSFSHDDG